MLAIIAPGQGSQKPGFLTPWLDLNNAEARLRWWSVAVGLDLVHLGTKADAEEIRDTARTQPLLVAAGLLAAEQLPLYDVSVLAGHSIGELTAATIAGSLSPESAVMFAGVRGREMADACSLEKTGMSAVLGGDTDQVMAAIEAAGLTAANRNGAGQIVAAGSLTALESFPSTVPKTVKVREIPVAGAFHTPYMAAAEEALDRLAGGITASDPTKLLLSNMDGCAISTGADLVQRLVRQVTTSVRWDLCMATLTDLGVTGILELPPAGVLTNLAKRHFKGKNIVPELLTLNSPDDLPAARDLIARHGEPSRLHGSAEPGVGFRVSVAPVAGMFHRAEITEGATVKVGDVIGQVTARQGATDVASHATGVLVEWLADEDDPVAPGQPLARFAETGEHA